MGTIKAANQMPLLLLLIGREVIAPRDRGTTATWILLLPLRNHGQSSRKPSYLHGSLKTSKGSHELCACLRTFSSARLNSRWWMVPQRTFVSSILLGLLVLAKQILQTSWQQWVELRQTEVIPVTFVMKQIQWTRLPLPLVEYWDLVLAMKVMRNMRHWSNVLVMPSHWLNGDENLPRSKWIGTLVVLPTWSTMCVPAINHIDGHIAVLPMFWSSWMNWIRPKLAWRYLSHWWPWWAKDECSQLTGRRSWFQMDYAWWLCWPPISERRCWPKCHSLLKRWKTTTAFSRTRSSWRMQFQQFNKTWLVVFNMQISISVGYRWRSLFMSSMAIWFAILSNYRSRTFIRIITWISMRLVSWSIHSSHHVIIGIHTVRRYEPSWGKLHRNWSEKLLKLIFIVRHYNDSANMQMTLTGLIARTPWLYIFKMFLKTNP